MLPDVVKKTLDLLCQSLSARTTYIESVYLYGSIALNGYIEGSSDIDFLAIVKEPLSEADIQAIAEAHEEVERVLPSTDIMGAYLLLDDLMNKGTESSPILTYYNKQLNTTGAGADINPVTWWILKKHGIKVYGSDFIFHYDLDIDALQEYVIRNLNSYWVQWIERLEKQLMDVIGLGQEINEKQLDEAVEWCTLGMLRQLYTLNEYDITSKIGAGIYGMESLPAKWHGLIQEAMMIKQLKPDRHYMSQRQRLDDLAALLRFIHSEANRRTLR
jgi:hypothetical protein